MVRGVEEDGGEWTLDRVDFDIMSPDGRCETYEESPSASNFEENPKL